MTGSVAICHQWEELNSWQAIVDAAINLCEDKGDKWNMKYTLNVLFVEENAAEKKFYLTGNRLEMQILKQELWDKFSCAFNEILPDYTFQLKTVSLAELDGLNGYQPKEAEEAPQAEIKRAPRYISLLNPSQTPLWDSISWDFKERFGETVYKAWFSEADIIQNFTEKILTIRVRSGFFKSYIEDNYLPKLKDFMANHASDYKIKIEVK